MFWTDDGEFCGIRFGRDPVERAHDSNRQVVATRTPRYLRVRDRAKAQPYGQRAHDHEDNDQDDGVTSDRP